MQQNSKRGLSASFFYISKFKQERPKMSIEKIENLEKMLSGMEFKISSIMMHSKRVDEALEKATATASSISAELNRVFDSFGLNVSCETLKDSSSEDEETAVEDDAVPKIESVEDDAVPEVKEIDTAAVSAESNSIFPPLPYMNSADRKLSY